MQYFVGIAFIGYNLDYKHTMKREKEQWLRIFNGVMFGALILLGFAYCDENSMGQEVRIVLLMPNMNSEVKYWERAGRLCPMPEFW